MKQTSIPKSKWAIHANHCCERHGCKYGDKDCPVVIGLFERIYPCENCNSEKSCRNCKNAYICKILNEFQIINTHNCITALVSNDEFENKFYQLIAEYCQYYQPEKED